MVFFRIIITLIHTVTLYGQTNQPETAQNANLSRSICHLNQCHHDLNESVFEAGVEYVISSDISDPILVSHIQEAGPGWELPPHSPKCQDMDVYDCQLMISENNCTGPDTGTMLIYCRESCRRLYQHLHFHDLPEDIQQYGGVQEFFEDDFGFRMNVCDLAEGFTEDQMSNILHYLSRRELQTSMVTNFTERGFLHTDIPSELYKQLLIERDRSLDSGFTLEEYTLPGIINHQVVLVNEKEGTSVVKVINRTTIIHLNEEIRESLFKTLGPLAEEWAGVKLVPSSIYGIRRYKNNSQLAGHLDRPHSHVISAILNIGQDVEEDWPLYIKDNQGNNHKVLLRPGQMLWYESARLLHGRQRPFKGSHYDNVFVHYQPAKVWYKPEDSERWERGEVEPITREAVLWGQRKLRDTSWDKAWEAFEEYTLDHQVERSGIKGLKLSPNKSHLT